eukprot:COSAG02_NODE_1151_length_14205_cov_1183.813342_10_plen_92_part_00
MRTESGCEAEWWIGVKVVIDTTTFQQYLLEGCSSHYNAFPSPLHSFLSFFSLTQANEAESNSEETSDPGRCGNRARWRSICAVVREPGPHR